MEYMHWMFVCTALLGMPAVWLLFAPFNRNRKPWNEQMTDRITRSKALAVAYAKTIEAET